MTIERTKCDRMQFKADMTRIRKGQLTQWLDKHNAKLLWVKEHTRWEGMPRFTLKSYNINGSVCIIQEWSDGGWDIYTAHSGTEIDATLADAEERLGLK